MGVEKVESAPPQSLAEKPPLVWDESPWDGASWGSEDATASSEGSPVASD
ncbi:MAG: hypothetical protein JWO85_2667 [Candidatus Eremiobacteraeota bacterium]|nr:hypothetical protein [Candidatus Eremiobacteraeota bacterium]